MRFRNVLRSFLLSLGTFVSVVDAQAFIHHEAKFGVQYKERVNTTRTAIFAYRVNKTFHLPTPAAKISVSSDKVISVFKAEIIFC